MGPHPHFVTTAQTANMICTQKNTVHALSIIEMNPIKTWNIRAVLLDIDDTLYLERDYVRSGFAAVGRAIGNSEFGDLCFDYFLQGIRGNTFDLAREKLGITKEIGELVEIYRSHWPNIQLCKDARDFLESCRLRLGVITDGPIASQRAKMQALGLLTWIDLPLFTTEIRAPKPSEVPFKLAAMALDTPFDQCVYIADNPRKDFIGAHHLGMHTIRIRRPDSLHFDKDSGDDVDLELEDFTVLTVCDA